MNIVEWIKKKAQVIDKSLKPEGPQFKDPGVKEKLIVNPKPEAFDVPASVQQEIVKEPAPISSSEKMPEFQAKPYSRGANLSWFKKVEAADVSMGVEDATKGYRDPGTKEKLNYKPSNFKVNVSQPTADVDAAGKQYKDSGTKEKLEYPTGETKMPNPGITVVTDTSVCVYKDEGEKEKLITKPKEFTVKVSQPKSDVPGNANYPKDAPTPKPFQKQFSQINWFRKTASPELTSFERGEIAELIREQRHKGKSPEQAAAIAYSEVGKTKKSSLLPSLLVLERFAEYCPGCFQQMVDYAIQELEKKKVSAMNKAEAEAKRLELQAVHPEKKYVVAPTVPGGSEYTVVDQSAT